MSDLDLDAIRERYEQSRQQAPDSTTWTVALHASSADVPTLLAEVERLKAHQPDGGEWQYGVEFDAIRAANRHLHSAIIASAHRLDIPFTDAPDQSPWTRIKSAMASLDAEIAALLAEVERLKAHQPDGGEWVTEYGHFAAGRFWRSNPLGLRWTGDTHQRRVRIGPAEPIAEAAE